MYDYLIVGAGLYGSTFAERAKSIGKKILVIDQRNHVGGNCYTEEIHGINVHMYGPHIFHTNNENIWNYINRFAKFNNFTNRVKASHCNKLYSFPVNLFTLYQLWGIRTPTEAINRINEVKINIKNPKNMEEWCLANVGEEIYNTFFRDYTTKQWHVSPSKIPISVIKRLPIRFTYDDNYYSDTYQGIPIGGYTQIFHKMLDGVEVKLNTKLEKNWRSIAKHLIYSGRPDELLDHQFGVLPYITLKFEHEVSDGDFQGNAVINYVDNITPYTRSVEHKHFEFGSQSKTIVTKEYPHKWCDGSIPYYAMHGYDHIYKLYKEKLDKSHEITVGGRLGCYKYLDMHHVISNAMRDFKNLN